MGIFHGHGAAQLSPCSLTEGPETPLVRLYKDNILILGHLP